MKLLHILGGLGLILLTVGGGVQPLRTALSPRQRTERLTTFGVFTGLVWAAVLFTGFFQLGSVNTLSDPILYKLGATVLGGALGLGGMFVGAKRAVPWVVFYGLVGGALGCFGVSLYWALFL